MDQIETESPLARTAPNGNVKSTSPSRLLVIALIMSLAYLVGATINWLPVTFKIFEAEFTAGLEAQGRTWSLFFVGGICIAALGGWLTTSLGIKRAIAGTLFLLGCGMGLIGLAPLFWVLLIGCFLFGMGNNWMTVVYSTLVSSQFEERRQALFLWANAALGVGSFVTLPLLGLWFEQKEYTGGWRTAYAGLGAACVGTSLVLLISLPATLQKIRTRKTSDEPKSSATSLLAQGSFWLIGICFFLYAMAQLGISSWVGQLYRYRLSIDDTQAGLLLGVNGIGYLAGLVSLSFFSMRRKLNDRILLASCAGTTTLVLLALILNQSYPVAVALMVLEGATIAGSGPAIFSFVSDRFAKEGAAAFALLIGFSQIGAAAGPYTVGFLGDRLGSLEIAIWMIPATSGVLALLSFTWEFLERRADKIANKIPAKSPNGDSPG